MESKNCRVTKAKGKWRVEYKRIEGGERRVERRKEMNAGREV